LNAPGFAGELKALFTSLESVASIAIRTVVIYAFVLLGLRVSGKREVGQMTPFDLVLILLIANAVQNAMLGQDTSLMGGLTAALVLFVLNRIVGKLAFRSRRFGQLLRGHSRLLVNRGVALEHNLASEGLSHEELMQSLREHGVATLEDVRLAVLEVDGTISVLKNEDVSEETHKPHRRFRFRKN
jgi:uncharacterized membrane protein YcaP (DUF421 family)